MTGEPFIIEITRRELIEDGTLIDVSAGEHGAMVKEAGFRQPLAMTAAVYRSCVALTPAAEAAGCDEKGRLWDILWMARVARRPNPDNPSEALFDVRVVVDDATPVLVTLRLVCEAGDDGQPVLTVLYPFED